MVLDDKAYQIMKEKGKANFFDGKQNWYKKSYPLFINHPINEIEDFLKIVAFAYSWMPTIPKLGSTENLDTKWLLQNLKALQKGDLSNREELLTVLIAIINNSLVGRSKVLHFIAPSFVPIIDSRVLRGWKKFSEDFPNYEMPKLPSPNVALNDKHIKKYILYWDALLNWQERCKSNIKLKDFEKLFYDIGIK